MTAEQDAAEPFAMRRIEIAEPLDDFFFDDQYRNLIGAARDGVRGVVVNLEEGARLPSCRLMVCRILGRASVGNGMVIG